MSDKLAGEYLLQGVREMASGFLLKPDNSFQFFFSYGALDRQARGTWKKAGDTIIFNSGKWPGADFTIVHSEPGTEEGILVQLEQPNPMLAAYLRLSLVNGAEDSWIQFRQHGHLHLPPQSFDSLSIQFEFCPERFSVLPVFNGHTSFTIRPEQTLFELYLENFSLLHTPEGLSGRHPLLQGDLFKYDKQR